MSSLFIHTTSTINIRQYGIISRTNNIKLLRRWWNFLPITWFNTDSFFDSFKELFNSNSNPELNESYKILSYNNIIMLDMMLKTISVLMKNTNDRTVFGILLQRQTKSYKGNFDFYINKVESITGIKIKDGEDLTRLQGEIQRLWDKHQNKYKPKEEEKKSDFFEDAMTIFLIMEMPYIPEMKLIELAALKIKADAKILQLTKKNDEQKVN